MRAIEHLTYLLDYTDEELKEIMAYYGMNKPFLSKLCMDILILRRHENLVNETKGLVTKTWWVAFATWVLAGATIIIICIQFFKN
jgi:hypothetical protein